jgi:hypothetical protein
LDPNERQLVESNPAAQKKYVSTLEQSFKNSGISKRVEKLEHDLKYNIISRQEGNTTYNKIDKEITGMMLGSEKSCRKKTKGVTWSMKLVAAGRKVRYWRTRLSDQINGRESSLRLVHLGRTLEIL